MRFRFIHAEKANYPVRVMCRVLNVSTSGYYAYLEREPSRRQREDERLKVHIGAIHVRSRGTYGRARVGRQLLREDVEVGKQRVARLMREMGLQGLPRKRFRRTTDSNHARPVAPNVLDRNFEAERPNQSWVTDITFVWTSEGWLYLAAILELFSRRVVGWAMQPHMRTELALEALHMALGRCLPDVGLVHHSDRGVQYAAASYQAALDENNIVCSMSRKGDCWDNAVSESFFGTLKTELINRHSWSTRRAAKDAVVDYIEGFYNPKRLHSSLGYVSPIEFERMHTIETSCAT
jgi:transposase InsO family protein